MPALAESKTSSSWVSRGVWFDGKWICSSCVVVYARLGYLKFVGALFGYLYSLDVPYGYLNLVDVLFGYSKVN